MSSIERVRKRRGTTRGLTTKVVTKTEAALGEDRSNIDHRKLKQIKTDLEEKSGYLKELDAKILDSLYDENADSEACEKEAEEADDIQAKISFKLICIEEILKEIGKDETSSVASGLQRSESCGSVAESLNSICTTASQSQNMARVKLPKLEI